MTVVPLPRSVNDTHDHSVPCSVFDGLCGSVIGVVAMIAAQILKESVEGSERRELEVHEKIDSVAQNASAVLLYVLALAVLYNFNNKYTALLLVIFGAIAGQFIFVD